MKTALHFFFFFFIFIEAHAQVITTVAGCGDTTLGDGGLAVHAALVGPYGVALDGLGNFYITDGYHNRIRKVNAAGVITTIAGTGIQGYNGDGIPATAAQLYRPVGIIFDQSGNLYFCDGYNNRVRRIHTTGIITTIAGNGGSVYNGDNIAATAAVIYNAHCVAVDGSGNMYITDCGNHRVRRINTSGVITTIAGTGTLGYSGDNGPATNAMINFPYGIALDGAGNIYFADTYENVVRKIDTSGIITTFAGNSMAVALGDNGPATSAVLNHPIGIAIDGDNTVFITMASQERIRKVASGIITTVAGVGTLGFSGDNDPATNAQLAFPCGIALDAAGSIYFTDFANNRVRRIGWSVGIADLPASQCTMTLFPNPSPGDFTCNILSAFNEVLKIIITDITGRKIIEITAQTNTPSVIRLTQPNGVYILSAVSKSDIIKKKIIIAG